MLSLRGYILAKMGRTTDAEEVLNTLKGIAGDRYVPPYAMALVHAGLGQTRSGVRSGSTRPSMSGTCTLPGSCRIPSGTPTARTHGSADSSNAVTSCARRDVPRDRTSEPSRLLQTIPEPSARWHVRYIHRRKAMV